MRVRGLEEIDSASMPRPNLYPRVYTTTVSSSISILVNQIMLRLPLWRWFVVFPSCCVHSFFVLLYGQIDISFVLLLRTFPFVGLSKLSDFSKSYHDFQCELSRESQRRRTALDTLVYTPHLDYTLSPL